MHCCCLCSSLNLLLHLSWWTFSELFSLLSNLFLCLFSLCHFSLFFHLPNARLPNLFQRPNVVKWEVTINFLKCKCFHLHWQPRTLCGVHPSLCVDKICCNIWQRCIRCKFLRLVVHSSNIGMPAIKIN